jgi:hypothetical protein
MTTPQPSPYNPQIPQPPQSIAESQGNFLTNFMRLYEAYSRNHVPLDAASNAGNHNVVQLYEQPTGLATGTSEISIYSKDVVGQEDQIFIRFSGNGQEVQYTNWQIYALPQRMNGTTVLQTPYFTFLPGGLIAYFGIVFAGGVSFDLVLEPTICKNIASVSLCPTNVPNPAVFPSNASPERNTDGFFSKIVLSPAQTLSAISGINANQYYLIIGNI